jgi:hypothetical protein
MQLSFLSRNVLYISGASLSGRVCVMTNDGAISPPSISFSNLSPHRRKKGTGVINFRVNRADGKKELGDGENKGTGVINSRVNRADGKKELEAQRRSLQRGKP